MLLPLLLNNLLGSGGSPPPDFAGVAFIGGVAVDINGVMGTSYLSDGSPVPAGSVFVNGFAQTNDGLRYVAPWPESGIVYYEGGLARRADGAMIIVADGNADSFLAGFGLTYRGEVCVSTSAPDLILGGFGRLNDGSLCVSAAS